LRERLGPEHGHHQLLRPLSEAVLNFNPYDGQPPDGLRAFADLRTIDGKLCRDFSSAYRSTGPMGWVGKRRRRTPDAPRD
jgi:hypothetical protein